MQQKILAFHYTAFLWQVPPVGRQHGPTQVERFNVTQFFVVTANFFAEANSQIKLLCLDRNIANHNFMDSLIKKSALIKLLIQLSQTRDACVIL